MTPIETRYKGYRFRSRLEARWAVFFDALGLSWEYEPEGFVLKDGTHYLPDFRVTSPQGLVTWYEAKPEGVESDPKFEAFKAGVEGRDVDAEGHGILCCGTTRAVLLSGDPVYFLDGLGEAQVCPRCGQLGNVSSWDAADWAEWVYCESCDFNTPSGGDHPPERGAFGFDVTPYKGSLFFHPMEYRALLRRVRKAAEAARGARFEHNERK